MSDKDLQFETIKKDFLSKTEKYIDDYYQAIIDRDDEQVFSACREFNDESFTLIESLLAHAGLKGIRKCH